LTKRRKQGFNHTFKRQLTREQQKERPLMLIKAYIASESQLGRSKDNATITRTSLLKELAARGVRITSQRRLLVRIARQEDGGIDRATIYRTIALLKKRGLIDELDLMHIEGEKHYYEVKTNRDHCHMACFHCGAITEYASMSFEKLKQEIARRSGFEIRVARLELGGLCKACRNTAN
jgi:Fe2+ or Zn2+ uptake regulation protein